MFIGKTLNSDLTQVVKEVIEMVNYIKARPLKSRLFTKLCKKLEANYENLLLHTEARWLSRGKALSRVYELKEEMLAFFSLERQGEFCNLLYDDSWKSKLAYLVDIFDHLNETNSNMQGKNEKLLSSADKMRALQQKLKVWSLRIQEGNSGMFFHFSKTINKEMVSSVIKHLKSLQVKIEIYFPTVSTENYKWVRNPFLPLDTQCILNLKEEEELIDIRNDGNIKLLHREMPLDEFWIKIQNEYPNIGEKALIIILLQFFTKYLCETAFSVLTNLKTRKRERLLVVEEKMRVALLNVRPNIERIWAKNHFYDIFSALFSCY